MPRVMVEGLLFDFPPGWIVGKYDEWNFYRDGWTRMWNGIKAVDVLAVDPARTCWLIEAKDYGLHSREKPSELADEVGRKVFDTLAALIPARVGATDKAERTLAALLTEAKGLRVVLHLEQPTTSSRLRPRPVNPADIRQKLRQILHPVDRYPIVTDMARNGRLPWRVARA